MIKTGKLKKHTKLEKSIVTVSVIQLFFYMYTLFVIYSTNHDDNPSDFDAMYAIFPAFMFVLFGGVNLILFAIYLATRYRSKLKPKLTILIIIGVLILLTLVAGNITDFIDSL